MDEDLFLRSVHEAAAVTRPKGRPRGCTARKNCYSAHDLEADPIADRIVKALRNGKRVTEAQLVAMLRLPLGQVRAACRRDVRIDFSAGRAQLMLVGAGGELL